MRTIVLANPKGGVGKTTLAANLAAAWVATGGSCLLFDGDAHGGGASILLGSGPAQSGWLAPTPLDTFLSGLRLAGGPLHPLSQDAQTVLTLPHFEEAFAGEPLVIVDMPPGVPSYAQEVVCQADDIVLVVDSDPASLVAASRLARIAAFARPGARYWVWSNRSNTSLDRTGPTLARHLLLQVAVEARLLPAVPESDALRASVRARRVLVADKPKCRVARILAEAQQRLAAHGSAEKSESATSVQSLAA